MYKLSRLEILLSKEIRPLNSTIFEEQVMKNCIILMLAGVVLLCGGCATCKSDDPWYLVNGQWVQGKPNSSQPNN